VIHPRRALVLRGAILAIEWLPVVGRLEEDVGTVACPRGDDIGALVWEYVD
jgi:hypothetical protein